MPPILHHAVVAGLLLTGLAGPARAVLTNLGPTPYLSFADSPFSATGFSWFYLETLEDHLLNTPGVSGSAGGVTSVVFGPQIHDSVDADDGAIDGSGLGGDSYYSGAGATGVSFTFDAATLGALPTHAGIVWTDAGVSASVTFAVYGPGNVLLNTATAIHIADFNNNGETSEDRFFGAIHTNGISSIFVSNTSGGIEVDHLQYGVAAIPEPQTYALMLAGLCGVAAFIRRRKAG